MADQKKTIFLMRKIRIAYLELFHCGWHEDYSITPKKYGGGPIFARWAKEEWSKPNSKYEFYILAPKGCWEHIDETKENKSCFLDLPLEACEHLRNGLNIKYIIPQIDYFDIILHGHTSLAINNMGCKPVQVHWSGFGRASDGHQFIPYTFVYGPDLTPYFKNQKTFPIKIGKPVPKEFKFNEKEDFIFQCSRHDNGIDTIQVAKECINNNIKAYFAGPINGDYKLLDYIDNKNTFYLGLISEQLKIEFTKRARLSTFVYPLGEVFNQSVIECLAHGTPILRKEIQKSTDPTFRNWLKDTIIDNENGVVYNGSNFLDCWERSKNIDQKKCWESAKQYSVEEMLRTFEEGIEFVVKDAKIKLE